MAISLRHCAKCIGVSTPMSVQGRFFGVLRPPGPQNPALPAQSLSLRTQLICLAHGHHFHINLIRLGGAASFPPAQQAMLDRAVIRAREIWQAVGVTIGRVQWFDDNVAANAVLNSETEMERVTQRLSVSNNGVDCFMALDMTFADGFAPVTGPTLKGASIKDGLAVDCSRGAAPIGQLSIGRTLAHELGHYFGLDHNAFFEGDDNLMVSGGGRTRVRIASGQKNHAILHPMVHGGC